MAFERIVTLPWLARVEPPGTTRAFAQSRRTSFSATAGLALAGAEFNAATLGNGIVVPGGCSTITATFKFGINSFHTDAWVIPGPGFAFAQVGIDFLMFRVSRDPSTGATTEEVFTQRMILSRSIAPLTWIALDNGGSFFRRPFAVTLGRPTTFGEAWQFTMRAFAETAGGGFVAAASADVRGFLSVISITGTP
jgi:hypothetical protein